MFQALPNIIRGMDKDFKFRLAEINCTENEEKTLERIVQVMNIKGWKLDHCVACYAQCEVENLDEYKQFVADYKEVKKAVKLWEKHGI